MSPRIQPSPVTGSNLIHPGGYGQPDGAKRMLARYERARAKRDTFASSIDQAYEFAMPLRQRTYMSGQNSAPDVDRLFDGTAVTAIQGLASQMLDDVWPADQTPFELKAGPGVEADKKEEIDRNLAAISAQVIDVINNSSFRSAAHEMFLDYGIGTGVMIIEEGDAINPVIFRSIPLTACVLDIGPRDEIDALFIPRTVRAGEIMATWPKAKLSPELERMSRENPDAEVELLEGTERDWSVRNREMWMMRVMWRGSSEQEVILEERMEGVGARPFLSPSFTRAAGETMGRGPVLLALPDIRVLNKLTELMLEATDLALSGIWLADDDGIINADTAILEPGVIIPRSSGQGRGLENVAPNLNLQAGDNERSRLVAAIKEAMYVNDLGDITKTPKTATEIAQRTSDRARRLAGTYGRLLTEFLFPLVSRVWWILKKANGLGSLPPVDGDAIRVRPLSPLTRAQAQDDVTRHVTYLQTLAGLFGPQAPLLIVNTQDTAKWLADKMGFNPMLLNSKEQQGALLAQAQQKAQEMGMMPGAAGGQGAPPQGAPA